MKDEIQIFNSTFHGAWRGAGLSGSSCLSGFAHEKDKIDETDQRDQTDPHTRETASE